MSESDEVSDRQREKIASAQLIAEQNEASERARLYKLKQIEAEQKKLQEELETARGEVAAQKARELAAK